MTESHPEKKIIVIPAKNESPQEQAKKRNLRVAAYCRVSTGDEEQLTSYENQKAFYTEKIMKNPEWTMVDIFADEGITGTSTCRRKDFLRMIRQCRQGKIDMILAKSVSRFARNTLDTISYTRELRSLGIAVIFEEQNINSIYPESEFLIALHAAFAQSESESISANVRWGKRQSIKDGKVTFQYKTLLGYEKGPDGNPVIIPEEAETVRQIFEWYLAGKSVRISVWRWWPAGSGTPLEPQTGPPATCAPSSPMKNIAETPCSRKPSLRTASAKNRSQTQGSSPKS